MIYSDNTDTDTQADSIGDYLPNGPIYAAKRVVGTKLRSLLRGLAGTLVRAQEFMQITVDERDASNADLTIDLWEAAVGIPDNVFRGTNFELEFRQRDVITKLGRMNSSTKMAWEDLLALYGITATVESGWLHRGDFPVGPVGDKEAKFTIIIFVTNAVDPRVFPVSFPWKFGSILSETEAMLQQMKPSNVAVQFRIV